VKQSAVKVIGGVTDATAASPSSLTVDTPVDTATLYTVASPPPPPPQLPDTASSAAWTSAAVDLIECVECAAEVAQKRAQRRRGSLRHGAVPDDSRVQPGFCTCLRQPITTSYRKPSTSSCYRSVGWVADRAAGLQKIPLQQTVKLSSDGFDEQPADSRKNESL